MDNIELLDVLNDTSAGFENESRDLQSETSKIKLERDTALNLVGMLQEQLAQCKAQLQASFLENEFLKEKLEKDRFVEYDSSSQFESIDELEEEGDPNPQQRGVHSEHKTQTSY